MRSQSVAEPDLPDGLRHPYDVNAAKAMTYRHAHTFTWTRGDKFIAVQAGRVLNARTVRIIKDAYPRHNLIFGRRPIIDWIPAPPAGAWRRPEVMHHIADQWAAQQQVRTPVTGTSTGTSHG